MMLIFENLNKWYQFRATLSTKNSLGFIPTMGNLHAGHTSLFQTSKKQNSHTVASIFINPTQFNQTEDFKNYPRTLEADLELLQKSGVDACFLPNSACIYNDGYNYQIHEQELSQLMEGLHRPGHFNGVLTIVLKLLNIIKPHRAYFGEKDYQQFLLIQNMVKAFFMPVEIIPCPTIRESSSLAYSSRNSLLSFEQKLLANQYAKIFHQKQKCLVDIMDELAKNNIKIEYIEEFKERRFIAVTIGNVRLIDNYEL